MSNKIIVKNFFTLSLAQIVVKLVNFFIIAYLARVLSQDGFGKINFSLALVGYFALLINQGFDIYGTNRIAEDRSNISQTVNQIFTLRVILGCLYIISILIACHFLQVDLQILVLVYGVALFINGFLLNWVFQGIQKMSWIAIAQITNNLTYAILILLLVRRSTDIIWVPISYSLAILISVFVLLYRYSVNYRLPRLNFYHLEWKKIFSKSVPMGFSNIMILIYLNLDLLIIPIYRDFTQVGLYSACVKIMTMIVLIYSLILQVFYPNFSQYLKKTDQLKKIMHIYHSLLIAISLPIGFAGTLLAQQILHTVFGPEYLPAAVPFVILIWTKVIVAFNMAFGNPLLAWDQQKRYMLIVSIGAIVNVILNFILIPIYGITGAALATLVAEMCIFVLAYSIYQKIFQTGLFIYLKYPLIGSIGFLLTLLYFRNTTKVLFFCGISLLFYVVFMLIYSPLNYKKMKSIVTS